VSRITQTLLIAVAKSITKKVSSIIIAEVASITQKFSCLSCCLHFLAIQNLDAVVGDFSITSKCSQEVLFAQPLLDSGLVEVVPLKDQDTVILGRVLWNLSPLKCGY